MHGTFLYFRNKMQKMFIVREARLQDISVIANFQLAMAWETEKLELDPEVVSFGVKAVFEDSSKGVYYVADMDGEIVGSLLTTFEWSDWRNGTVLWIQSVYVKPGYRRRGIYSRMYSHLKEQVMSDPHLRGIRLYADVSNHMAHKVYEALGMNSEHYKTYEWMK